ncbi:MAG: hypothetical protein IJ436_04425 [Bacteroidaceae bacterium]|nr:hypothetical protein [Bacteroidaceae bacterium]
MVTGNSDENLREICEKVAGRKMQTPLDFDFLAMRILDSTNLYIAPITLKRFWGYLGEKRQKPPHRYTLNILAQYAGYIDYEEFVKSKENDIDSEFLSNHSLLTRNIQKGCKIELKWRPDRCVIVQYQGMNIFKVLESKNSKLSKGDTFQLEQFIDGESLILNCLIHEGKEPTNYICGRLGGIKFRII